jgi:hypothetical protein
MVLVVSDTVESSSWQQPDSSLLHGIIKTRVIDDELAISFAGSVERARQAFLALEARPSLTRDAVRDRLLEFHIESIRAGGTVEFLLACVNPPELLQIKAGTATETAAAWLGWEPGFRRFQAYATEQQEPVEPRPETAAFSIQALPDGPHGEQPSELQTAIYSALCECMRLVIEDAEIPEVGGFVVPVGPRGGRLSYLDYAAVVTHPLQFDLLRDGMAIPFGTAAEGGHAINLMADNRSSANGLALYLLQAQAGAAFKQVDGLLRPTVIRGATPISFEELLRDEFDIIAGTFYGDPAEYCDRAMIHLRAGQLEAALAEADRAVARTDKLATGFTCRGIVLGAMQRRNEAIHDFDRALAIDSREARALANRGVAKAQVGDLVGAKRDLDEALTQNTRYAFAYSARAAILRAMGDEVSASEDDVRARQIRENTAPG